jgi:HemY protein
VNGLKGLLWVIGLATLAVLAALVLQDFHGNVVVLVPPYRADMALAAFALALLLLFAALMGLLKLLSSLLSLPKLAAQYRAKRAEDHARNSLALAVVELAAGRFTRAYSAARAAAQAAALAPAANLLAAQAAHRLNNTEQRDALLVQSLQDPQLKEAALLTAAQAALDDRNPLKAREVLSQLSSGPARRVQSLRLKLDAARGASDHSEVIRIVQLLHKHGDLSPVAARALAEHAALAKLDAAQHDIDKLRFAWRELEQSSSKSGGKNAALITTFNPNLVAAAAEHFAALDGVPRARDIVCEAIEIAPADDREALFATLAPLLQSEPAIDSALLSRLERWRAAHPRSAAAALAAGAACMQQELWGKARLFLQDSVRLDTRTVSPADLYSAYSQADAKAPAREIGVQGKRACVLLAALEERVGESSKALAWYRQATATPT